MIITFYSYKGGVGRTQLLANTALGLANCGLDVVMVDMDLESPGLHRYFYNSSTEQALRLGDQDFSERSGVIDILAEFLQDPERPPDILKHLSPVYHPHRTSQGQLRLLPPGRLDESYPQRVSTFMWEKFYAENHGYAFMEYFRQTLLEGNEQRVILIDSRTGLTDIGNVCTGQLPDVLVIPFALHHQGIDGTRRIARAVNAYHKTPHDRPPRLKKIFLLPSRVEETGSLPDRDQMLSYASERLAGLGQVLDDIQDRLAYDPRIACGETMVVGSAAKDTNLSIAYARFIDQIRKMIGFSRDADSVCKASQPLVVPAELLGAIASLNTDVEIIGDLWHALQTTKNLETLPRLTHQIVDATDAACRHHDIIRNTGIRLVQENQAMTFEGLSEAPKTAEDWKSLLSKIQTRGNTLTDNWINRWKQVVHQRLTIAGDNPSEIENQLKRLGEFARVETADSLEAKIEQAEQFLLRHSLVYRLSDNTLRYEDLKRSMANDTMRRQWIEDQLKRLQEEGDTDDTFQKQLWNALKLLVLLPQAPLKRPDQAHWGAYDLLCMLTDKPALCFSEIGASLWQIEWQAYFATNPLPSPEWPCGLDARKQLQEVAKTKPEPFNALVERLANRFKLPHDPATFAHLFQLRNDDPVVKQAVQMIGKDPSIAIRRQVLGNWLSIHGPQKNDPILTLLLGALAEEGYAAEAMVGAYAYLAKFPEARKSNPKLWGDLTYRFMLGLLDNKQASQLNCVLLDEDFIRALIHSQRGVCLVLLLVLTKEPITLNNKAKSMLLATLSHDYRAKLPKPISSYLEAIEHGHVEMDEASIRKQLKQVQDNMKIAIYRSWDGAKYFKKAFESYWKTIFIALSEKTSSSDALVESLAIRDADHWIDKTFKTLRSQGKPLSPPKGSARQNLRETYQNMNVALQMLVKMRPDGASISQVEAHLAEQDKALNALQDWIMAEVSPEECTSPFQHILGESS